MNAHLVNERGATLVELLVALPVAALITAGVVGVYFQMTSTKLYVDNSVAAYSELQRAGAWFSRDCVQAQVVEDNNIDNDDTLQIAVDQDAGIAGAEVLVVEWTDWDDDIIRVVYSLASTPGSSLKELRRTVVVNGTVDSSIVAGNRLDDSVDAETLLNKTRFEWSSDSKDTVRFLETVESGQESRTATYEVRPRART